MFLILNFLVFGLIIFVCSKFFYKNGFNHGYNDGAFDKEAEWVKRIQLKDSNFKEKNMIIVEYSATCTTCGKNYGSYLDENNKEQKIRFWKEDELRQSLSQSGWAIYPQYGWVICPECNGKLEVLEPRVKWNGEEMEISKFLIKNLEN